MNPGQLTERVRVQEDAGTGVSDAYGRRAPVWRDVASLRCRLMGGAYLDTVRTSGGVDVEGGRVEMETWDRDDVVAGMRAMWLGTAFEVVAVDRRPRPAPGTMRLTLRREAVQ